MRLCLRRFEAHVAVHKGELRDEHVPAVHRRGAGGGGEVDVHGQAALAEEACGGGVDTHGRVALREGDGDAQRVALAGDGAIVGGAAVDRRDARARKVRIRGRDLLSPQAMDIEYTSRQAYMAVHEPCRAIVNAIRWVLERTPPELVADISTNGIVMTGGGSLVSGFDKLVTARTGIHTVVAENAISCVAEGTGKSLDSLNAMQDGTVNLSRRRQMN